MKDQTKAETSTEVPISTYDEAMATIAKIGAMVDDLLSENKRLKAENEFLQTSIDDLIFSMSDDQTIAASVREYKDAAKAVAAAHNTQVLILKRIIESYQQELFKLKTETEL